MAPSLILQGVGTAIANGPRFKILILNGSLDRETGGFEGLDFVKAIVRCCEDSSAVDTNALIRLENPSPNTNDDDHLNQRIRRFITHLIYIDHPSAPHVDREKLSACGVEGVRLYGRKGDDGKMRYDEKALTQALGMILGRRDAKERSRRNTMEGRA